MIRVDANYILRYLLNDNPEMASIAEQLFLNEQLFIANEILAEVVYVLLGVYEISKIDIADKLINLISCDTIFTDNELIIIEALTLFKSHKLDFPSRSHAPRGNECSTAPAVRDAARGNEEDYVTTIGREYDLVKSTSKRDKQAYNYIEIGDVDVSNGMATFNKIDVNELPDNAKQEVKTGDLLISKVRPNRGAVTIIDFDDTNLIVSGAFTVLREKEDSEFLNETLKVLLRTKIYRDWLLKFNVGTQYPVIRDEDILNLPIPKIDRETQNKIATLIQQSFTLKAESENLLATAKRAVEIAIETNEQTALNYINTQIGE